MSRNNNVNPAHYKVAGRERQGEAILQGSAKGAYAQQRHEIRLGAMEAQSGLPVWETTPPNLDIPDRPKPRARKKATRRRKPARKATSARKVARKTTARPKAVPARRARKAAPKRNTARARR